MSSLCKISLLKFVFSMAVYSGYAQPGQKEFDASNIIIKDSALKNFIHGIHKYILTQTNHFNYPDYFVSVYADEKNDSTYQFESFLDIWAYHKRSEDSIVYYGYAVKDNIFFIFWQPNKLVEKKPGFQNPELFDNSIRIIYPDKKHIKFPRPIYDPDVWYATICKEKIYFLYPDMLRNFIDVK